MTQCDLSAPDATCPRCGFVSKIRGAIRPCGAPLSATCGPGCQLKRTLSWLGARDDGSCGCDSYAAQMDAWGPDECENRMDEILDHLREAAAKKNLPFVRAVAAAAVVLAIRAARKELACSDYRGRLRNARR